MKRYELISLTLKDNKTNEIKEVLYDELDIINLLNKQDTTWQKLKEFINNRPYCAGYDIQEHGSRLLIDIIDKMQELEGEDVKD